MTNSFHITCIIRRDKVDSKSLAPIHLRITINGKKTEISSKRRINPTHWDVKNCQAKIIDDESKQLNLLLNTLKNKVYEIYAHLTVQKQEITLNKIKNLLEGNEDSSKTLVSLILEHNKDFESKVGLIYSLGSYKNYKTSYVYLKEFILHAYKRQDLTLLELDYQFVDRYYSYLLKYKPCNQNGAIKHIQRLKRFINYAIQKGLINKNPFNAFRLKFEPFSRAVLSWKELIRLSNLKLDNNRLMKVLDCFVFQCFTGLAYVDLKQLKNEHIIEVNGKKWIVIHRQKTNVKSTIPLLPQALIILDKYLVDGKAEFVFPVMSNQKMNVSLKVLSDLVGLKINLSTHTARHTFATTVTLENDVPIETISKMLGHNNIKTTQIYAKVLNTKIEKDMDKLAKKFNGL
jgi:integrase